MPAFLAIVPMDLPPEAPLPLQCAHGMPLVETVEQHLASQGIAVDSRVGPGDPRVTPCAAFSIRSSLTGSSCPPTKIRIPGSATRISGGSLNTSPPRSSSSDRPGRTPAGSLPTLSTGTTDHRSRDGPSAAAPGGVWSCGLRPCWWCTCEKSRAEETTASRLRAASGVTATVLRDLRASAKPHPTRLVRTKTRRVARRDGTIGRGDRFSSLARVSRTPARTLPFPRGQ